MVSNVAKTVDEYIASLPPDRRAAIGRVRSAIVANLPAGFDESMMWGMITYSVPLARFPDTYNRQPLCLAGLASQKNHMAVYLMGVYADDATRRWFEAEYKRSGKKLKMGKSCVGFKTLDDLPIEVIGQAIARFGVDEYIAKYEATRPTKKPAAKKAAAKKAAARKVATKKSAKR